MLWNSIAGISQQAVDFSKNEITLSALFDTVARGDNQHIRYHANERFVELLKTVLAKKGAFEYPFDSIQCQKLSSRDEKIRLFNWAVRKEEGMEFFALLMVHNEKTKKYQTFQLVDDSDAIFDLPNAVLDKDHWYGAYYNTLIQTEANGRTYYTLLGWNGNDQAINRRVIEILTLKPNGEPVFGANVFSWQREKLKRKVFEHSRQGSMILRFDYQSYIESFGGEGQGRKPKEKRIKAHMIVFDRLIPSTPGMSKNPETYVAAGGVYDALVWQNGKWTLKTDIIARNQNPPKIRNKQRRR